MNTRMRLKSAGLGLLGSILIATSLNAVAKRPLQAFDNDFKLEAKIIRTEFGVPHITASNLESLAFGSGYAFAEDNLCILADQVVKANSERSKYFGPDQVPGSGDSLNLINDFSYKALQVREQAEANIDTITENSQAMLAGYTAGYNKYLRDTGIDHIDPACAGQPWVRELEPVDLLTYTLSIALLPGTAQFLDLAFLAHPGDAGEFLPAPVVAALAPDAVERQVARIAGHLDQRMANASVPAMNEQELGSNGWGLGRDKTANGRGALLANPHFPHTGNLRFWQSHVTIPGVLDAMGGSLSGFPGPINIGFNKNIAWTHTFSTAEHFIVYQLQLDPDDRTRYLYNGETLEMEQRTITVDVAVAPGVVLPFSKDYYYSRFGVMIETPASLPLLTWDDNQAFTIRDANTLNLDPFDHWLAMNLASNLDEFKQAFRDFDGVIFNNTMYADKDGNAYYIDDSTVPFLNDTANFLLKNDPTIIATRQAAGFHILPGNTSLFDFIANQVPFEQAPQLERSDFVQNSNDSFWSTNPAEPLEGFSRLFGSERTELSLRTRMGLKLLQDSAGSDGRFTLEELEDALLSNRVFLGELVLDDLLARCTAQGSEPVEVNASLSVDISDACLALSQWNRVMDRNSIGAVVYREFAHLFSTSALLAEPFDFTDPANTPNTLLPAPSEGEDPVLQILARAQANVEAAGFSPFAELGDVQFVEKSTADGNPSGDIIPWPGAYGREGGFNVFRPDLGNNGTLLPRHIYTPANDVVTGNRLSSGLSPQGYQITSGSSWMFVLQFTRKGPEARGLLTYSQSRDVNSPWFDDQTRLYSNEKTLRPLYFKRGDIYRNAVSFKYLKEEKEGRRRYLVEQFLAFLKRWFG